MATFMPPTVADLPSVNPPNSDPQERSGPLGFRLFRHFGIRGSRGRSVLKVAGVYTTVDIPTSDQCDSCDPVVWPDGELRPEFYLGGHRYEVTAAQAAALTAAGYGAWIS